MENGIYIASSGAVAQQTALDNVANNVANASTDGFKGNRVSFSQALQMQTGPDSRFVQIGKSGFDPSAGALQATGNPLDVAVQGDGYFSVDTKAGPRYTRAGNFRIGAEGNLIDASGNNVRGANGQPIAIPEGAEVRIDGAGKVWAGEDEIGELELAVFEPGNLRPEGNNLLVAKGAPRADAERPELLTGTLEKSNVNVVRGVVDMVRISRTYESLMRVIETYRNVDNRTARDIGGPR